MDTSHFESETQGSSLCVCLSASPVLLHSLVSTAQSICSEASSSDLLLSVPKHPSILGKGQEFELGCHDREGGDVELWRGRSL